LGISALKPGHKLLVVAAIVVVIGLVALLFAIWIVFYSFVIEAMIGGHWFAEHIFPITVSFSVIFFIAIVAVAFYTYQRVSVLDEWVSYNNMERIWRINRDWHLATYRNVVSIFVTFVLQVIILSVTVSNYFEPKRSGPWQCILPLTSSSVPPYSSCNVYWAGAVLALQCTLWVYLICIIQAFATLTIKVQLSRQVTRALK